MLISPADARLARIGAVDDLWAGAPDDPARRSWTVPGHGATLLKLGAA